MIRNQWYAVMDSVQVKKQPVGVTRMGENMVFWRNAAGQVSCLYDKCIHRGVKLSKGKVINGCLQCPFHGLEYDSSGRVTVIPANGKNSPIADRFKVGSYPTHEARGFIWIWWGHNPPADLKTPRFFDDIDEKLSYGTVYDHWNTHYSRVIENQLDVAHLPFVHHNTIGRGRKTLVDGPGLQWIADDMFYVYFYNRKDDGTPPRKPDEVPVPDPDKPFKLEFIFPNLWQNHISEDMRIVAAFVPVDDDNTILYLRLYQKFMRWPLLRTMFNKLAAPSNLIIAHQDRGVVVTQEPKASSLRVGEELIQADMPIIEYRKKREQLKRQAGG